MREIKFRAWDKKFSKMVNDITLINSYDKLDRFHNTVSSHDLIFQQYTGLKDKSGKEIYEGDILELKDEFIIEIKEMFEGHFTWREIDEEYSGKIGNCGIFPFDCNYKPCEVIGNIYKNPELIK